MAHQGWDSLTIDLQHGMVDYRAMGPMLQAISTTKTVLVVRVPWLKPGILMKTLDAGAYGVIAPWSTPANTPKIQTRMITAPQIAREAAAQLARGAGITPYILGDSLEGEARDLGKAMAGDTNGVDGAEEVAGAILTPNTLARAWALGDAVVTGPTRTNVNDFRAILIERQ